MKAHKIESIEQLVEFIDEYYDTEHKSIVLKAVQGFLNTRIVRFGDESKESFRTKVESFYKYCLTSETIPTFLVRNPSDEFNIKDLADGYC